MRIIMTPASRRDDPASSYEAEKEMNKSGKRTKQQQQALELVQRFPNSTSDELADVGVLDRYQLARRLPELETAGEITRGGQRKSLKTGRPAVTWHPKFKGF